MTIECRPAVYIDGGEGNIMPPHVTHPAVTTDNAGHPLTISVAVTISGGAAHASVEILDNTTGYPVTVASSAPSTKAVGGNATLLVTIPQVKLWSPENRSMYIAVVTLGAKSAPLDEATTRFGVRTITVADGYKLMLNGQRQLCPAPSPTSPPYISTLSLSPSHLVGFFLFYIVFHSSFSNVRTMMTHRHVTF